MRNKIIRLCIVMAVVILILSLFIVAFASIQKSVFNEKVSGIIIRPQLWDGNITVVGDVFVVPWISLTIAPGTIILFEKDTDIEGTDWTKWADDYIIEHNDPTGKEGYGESHFEIAAKIIAMGTKENPIIFTSAQTKKEYADWDQLVLFSGSILENVDLSFAHNGINLDGEGVVIKNSIIHNSLWSCIDVFSTDNLIEGNEVYHCWHQAIGFKAPGKNVVKGNDIHDSQLSVNCEFGANPEVKDNRFKSAPYNPDCPENPTNEIIGGSADTDGGTYNGLLVYPSTSK